MEKAAAQHPHPGVLDDSAVATRIRTPFGADSTALEVVDAIDLTGRRAVVTGGSSGIGIETARALASAGAEVTITGRELTAGQDVVADIARSTGNRDVHLARLELVDRTSKTTGERRCADWALARRGS